MAGIDVQGSRILDGVRDTKILRDSLPNFRHDRQQAGRVLPRTQFGDSKITESYERRPFDLQTHRSFTLPGSQSFKPEMKLPMFDGSSLTLDFLDWFDTFEDYFEAVNPPDAVICKLAASKLKGEALAWWKELQDHRFLEGKNSITSWPRMRKLLIEKFLHTSCLTYFHKQENKLDMMHTNCSTICPLHVKAEQEENESVQEENDSVDRIEKDDTSKGNADRVMPTKCLTEVSCESYINQQGTIGDWRTLDGSGIIPGDHISETLEKISHKPTIDGDGITGHHVNEVQPTSFVEPTRFVVPGVLMREITARDQGDGAEHGINGKHGFNFSRNGKESEFDTKADDAKDEQSRQRIHLKPNNTGLFVGEILLVNFDPGGMWDEQSDNVVGQETSKKDVMKDDGSLLSPTREISLELLKAEGSEVGGTRMKLECPVLVILHEPFKNIWNYLIGLARNTFLKDCWSCPFVEIVHDLKGYEDCQHDTSDYNYHVGQLCNIVVLRKLLILNFDPGGVSSREYMIVLVIPISEIGSYLVTAYDAKVMASMMTCCCMVGVNSMMYLSLWEDIVVCAHLPFSTIAFQLFIILQSFVADSHTLTVNCGATNGRIGHQDLTPAIKDFMLQRPRTVKEALAHIHQAIENMAMRSLLIAHERTWFEEGNLSVNAYLLFHINVYFSGTLTFFISMAMQNRKTWIEGGKIVTETSWTCIISSLWKDEFQQLASHTNGIPCIGRKNIRSGIGGSEFFDESQGIMFHVLLAHQRAFVEDLDYFNSLGWAVVHIGTLKERMVQFTGYEDKREANKVVEFWVLIILTMVQIEWHCFYIFSKPFLPDAKVQNDHAVKEYPMVILILMLLFKDGQTFQLSKVTTALYNNVLIGEVDCEHCGSNLTRGRVIHWKGCNDDINTNEEGKPIKAEIIVVIIDSNGNVLWKNGQSREFLPHTLVQRRKSRPTSRIVVLACIVVLFVCVMFMDMKWAKGICGYIATQHGLDTNSSQFKLAQIVKSSVGGLSTFLFSAKKIYITRGRVIPLEVWNDEHNSDTEEKFIPVELNVVTILCKNGQVLEALKLFHKVVNGLDPPKGVNNGLGSSNVLNTGSLVDELFE